MTTEVRHQKMILCQTGTIWGTWVTHGEMIAMSGSEGSGQVIGNMVIHRPYGKVRRADPTYVSDTIDISTDTPLDIAAQWVRVLIEDDTGTDATYAGKTWTAFWWGMVDSVRRIHHGDARGTQEFYCVGLAIMLDRITLRRGWEGANNSTGQIDPGYLPKFNDIPGGDRSTFTSTLDLERAVYIHDRRVDFVGMGDAYWRAGQIIELLLAGFSPRAYLPEPSPGVIDVSAVKWELSDPEGVLTYVPNPVDFNGKTVLQAVNTLAGSRRGISWYLSVVNDVAIINVVSITPTDIVTTATQWAYTLLASTHTWEPDLSTSPFIQNLVINEDYSAVYDYIEVIGDKPWTTISLELSGTPNNDGGVDLNAPFAKGWSATEEDNFLLANWLHTPSGVPICEAVYRKFILAPTWSWQQYGGSSSIGVNNVPEVGATTENGWAGYTGASEHQDDNYDQFPSWPVELTRELPNGFGFNTVGAGTRQGPLAFFSPDGSNWWDLNGTYNMLPGSFQLPVAHITVDAFPGCISIGLSNEDANKVMTELRGGGKYLFTVGVREPMPLRVSWQLNAANRPRDAARVMSINVPMLKSWIIKAGTVKGVNIIGGGGYGPLLTEGSDRVIGQLYGIDQAKMLLGLLKAYYSVPARTIAWSDKGLIDTSNQSGPARLITAATLDDGGTPVTVNAVITRRSWDFTSDGYGTSYDTDRLVPDVEAML